MSSRQDRYPSYSPDGSRIAFVSVRSGDWEVWVCDSDGSNPVQLTSFRHGGTERPSWSTDGKQIRFTSNAEGHSQDYVIDVTGGTARKFETLSGAAARLFPPRGASPDRKLRYFTRDGGVLSVPIEGGQERAVFTFPKPIMYFEVCAAGIYFLTFGTTSPSELMFYRFPNGPITKVAAAVNPAQVGLSVSPDGRWLLYTKLTSLGSDLMLVESFN